MAKTKAVETKAKVKNQKASTVAKAMADKKLLNPLSAEENNPKRDASATLHVGRPSVVVDTRVVYCGDNLEQLKKLPDGCVDLIYIDPPFNSNRNYEVFWERRRIHESMTKKRTHEGVIG